MARQSQSIFHQLKEGLATVADAAVAFTRGDDLSEREEVSTPRILMSQDSDAHPSEDGQIQSSPAQDGPADASSPRNHDASSTMQANAGRKRPAAARDDPRESSRRKMPRPAGTSPQRGYHPDASREDHLPDDISNLLQREGTRKVALEAIRQAVRLDKSPDLLISMIKDAAGMLDGTVSPARTRPTAAGRRRQKSPVSPSPEAAAEQISSFVGARSRRASPTSLFNITIANEIGTHRSLQAASVTASLEEAVAPQPHGARPCACEAARAGTLSRVEAGIADALDKALARAMEAAAQQMAATIESAVERAVARALEAAGAARSCRQPAAAPRADTPPHPQSQPQKIHGQPQQQQQQHQQQPSAVAPAPTPSAASVVPAGSGVAASEDWRDFQREIESWWRSCLFCRAKGLQPHDHRRESAACPSRGPADGAAFARASSALKDDLIAGGRIQKYSCCFLCGLPQRVCARWEARLPRRDMYVRAPGGECQHPFFGMDLLAALIAFQPRRLGDAMRDAGLGRGGDSEGVDFRGDEALAFLAKKVKWGELEMMRGLRVAYTVCKLFP